MSAATQTRATSGRANGKAKGLAAKLVEAALEVTHVEKKGRNTQQNYDYATADDVATAARGALLKRGVIADFHVLDAMESPITSQKGADGLMVKATCQLIVTDSESGEQIERTAIGFGSDFPGDKAIYKAMTGARKYAFIHLLQIPIGDDPERDAPQAQQAQGSAPNARAKAPQSSQRPATAKQQGKLNALFAAAELPAEAAQALVQWTSGQPIQDRLSSKQASALIDALGEDGSGAHGLIDKLTSQAEAGEEKAAKALAILNGGE